MAPVQVGEQPEFEVGLRQSLIIEYIILYLKPSFKILGFNLTKSSILSAVFMYHIELTNNILFKCYKYQPVSFECC